MLYAGWLRLRCLSCRVLIRLGLFVLFVLCCLVLFFLRPGLICVGVFCFVCLVLISIVLFCVTLQMSVEQMAKATRGLPEFQELSKKMSQHVRLSQECMDKVRTTLTRYNMDNVRTRYIVAHSTTSITHRCITLHATHVACTTLAICSAGRL